MWDQHLVPWSPQQQRPSLCHQTQVPSTSMRKMTNDDVNDDDGCYHDHHHHDNNLVYDNNIVRRKQQVSIACQPDDGLPLLLLLPKQQRHRKRILPTIRYDNDCSRQQQSPKRPKTISSLYVTTTTTTTRTSSRMIRMTASPAATRSTRADPMTTTAAAVATMTTLIQQRPNRSSHCSSPPQQQRRQQPHYQQIEEIEQWQEHHDHPHRLEQHDDDHQQQQRQNMPQIPPQPLQHHSDLFEQHQPPRLHQRHQQKQQTPWQRRQQLLPSQQVPSRGQQQRQVDEWYHQQPHQQQQQEQWQQHPPYEWQQPIQQHPQQHHSHHQRQPQHHHHDNQKPPPLEQRTQQNQRRRQRLDRDQYGTSLRRRGRPVIYNGDGYGLLPWLNYVCKILCRFLWGSHPWMAVMMMMLLGTMMTSMIHPTVAHEYDGMNRFLRNLNSSSIAGVSMQYQLDCDPCLNRHSYQIHVILHCPAPPPSSQQTAKTTAPGYDDRNSTDYIASWKQQIIRAMNQSANDMGIQFRIDFFDIPMDMNHHWNETSITQMNSLILQSLNDVTIHGLIVSIPDGPNNNVNVNQFYANTIINHTKPIYVMDLQNNDQMELYHLQSSVSHNHEQIGEFAANEFMNYFYRESMMESTSNTTMEKSMLLSAAYVQLNYLPGSSLSQQNVQYDSFRTLLHNNGTNNIDLIYIDNPYDVIDHQSMIDRLFNESCPYDAILLSSELSLSYTVVAKAKYQCSKTQIGVADMSSTSSTMYDYLSNGSIVFGMDPQIHIQSSFVVLILALNIMTGMQLPIPSLASFDQNVSMTNHNDTLLSYVTSPVVIRQDSVPTDTYQNYRLEAFPMCDFSSSSSSSSSDVTELNFLNVSNTMYDTNGTSSNMHQDVRSSLRNHGDCIDRTWIRIGGVVHGDTSDTFWDPVFASAHQAANDMHIQLDMIRLQPQSSHEVIYEQMSARIRSLCESNVDGIFVTIPNETLIESIEICQALRIPVISINMGRDIAEQLNLFQHIGQDEYIAGQKAAELMIAAGMKYGYCIDHTKGLSNILQRCAGFQHMIQSSSSAVQYMGRYQVGFDNRAQYKAIVESIVSNTTTTTTTMNETNDWSEIGLLAMGPIQTDGLYDVVMAHPNVIAGTFDTSPDIYNGLQEKWVQFAIDQQSYYQGNLPVYLLTYLAYSKQSLLNQMIETGPGVITMAPSQSQAICEANFYQVCLPIPPEDLNMIPSGFLALGYTMFGILTVTCIMIIIWILRYRNKRIVAVAQPGLLIVVVIGCFISSLSITFMGVQSTSDGNDEATTTTSNAITTSTTTTSSTTGNNPSLHFVNASCMTVVWLYGIGFILTFSAIFAKVQRVKLIYTAGLKMQRKTIGIKDVAYVMAILLCIELIILICWQTIAPLHWDREVLEYQDGYPTASVGKCTSSNVDFWVFGGLMFVFHVMCLCYALVLCFQTKELNSDFAESGYISLAVAFIFQVMILVIPVSMLVIDSTTVFYFLKVCAVFLQNSSVLLLLFIPKMIKLYVEQEKDQKDTVSITDVSVKDIGQPVVYDSTSLKRVARYSLKKGSQISGLSLNSLKNFEKMFSANSFNPMSSMNSGLSSRSSLKTNIAAASNDQFSMLNQIMNNTTDVLGVNGIDPTDLKEIESKLKRSFRRASVLSNYELSNAVGPISHEKKMSRISEAFTSITETFESKFSEFDSKEFGSKAFGSGAFKSSTFDSFSNGSVVRFFSEHNVSIADDIMPLYEEGNKPIDLNDLSISNHIGGHDEDAQSEGSYDLMADVSEQRVTTDRFQKPKRLGNSESNFWKIDEENSSLSDDCKDNDDDDIHAKVDLFRATRTRLNTTNCNKSQDGDNETYNDHDDLESDDLLGVPSNQDDLMDFMNRSLMDLTRNGKITTTGVDNRRKPRTGRKRTKTQDPPNIVRGGKDRKSGSSDGRSPDDVLLNGNRKNRTNTFISRWQEFGFQSMEQAEFLTSITSTSISPEERRILCSKVEIIQDPFHMSTMETAKDYRSGKARRDST